GSALAQPTTSLKKEVAVSSGGTEKIIPLHLITSVIGDYPYGTFNLNIVANIGDFDSLQFGTVAAGQTGNFAIPLGTGSVEISAGKIRSSAALPTGLGEHPRVSGFARVEVATSAGNDLSWALGGRREG